MVFVDTPGRHVSDKKLNKKLMEVSDRSVAEADLILYILDALRAPGVEEEAIASALGAHSDTLVVAINKIDAPRSDAGAVRTFAEEKFPNLPAERILTISAIKGTGIDGLLGVLFKMAGEGEPLYDGDTYTDQDVQFRIAEVIREKAMNRLREELPHSIYVDVEDTELREEGSRLWVRAFIIVERESQKGIVVGKGGEQIKAIRQAAQRDLNRIFDWKVELDLRVKTSSDWRQNETVLRRLIDRR